MVFQDPFNALNPRKKIGWILEEPLRAHHRGNRDEIRHAAVDMLKGGGFSESNFNKLPHQLSGGQRQRIGILSAFILNPDLVVADEPVSALDVSIQASILNFMKDLQMRHRLTYLFISHDLRVIHHIADRVGVMYLGRIVEIANVKSIYVHPGHPYTQALVSAIPNIGGSHGEGALLKGDVPDSISLPKGCPFHTRCPKCLPVCEGGLPPQMVEISDGHSVACHLFGGEGK